jgi:hypothetical protein
MYLNYSPTLCVRGFPQKHTWLFAEKNRAVSCDHACNTAPKEAVEFMDIVCSFATAASMVAVDRIDK